MKSIYKTLFFVLFLFTTYSQAQDWIKDYEYIPIVSPSLWWGWIRDYPQAVTDMKNAGVDVIRWEVEDLTKLDSLLGFGFKVIPLRTLGLNYIQYYTDAKYSIWEAEGTPLGLGEATLEHDSAKAYVDYEGPRTFLKLKPDSVRKTFEMINGPYYVQDVHYYTSLGNNLDTVIYNANYEMKLEWNRPTADTNFSYSPTTPICSVQVTQSYVPEAWVIGCTYPIVDTLLTYSDFLQLNQWKNFNFNYTLKDDSCAFAPSSNIPPPQYHPITTTSDEVAGPRNSREYIQFKVMWLGNPNFLLSVDKVTISDERGRKLIVTDTLTTKGLIEQQANSLSNHTEFVAGWLGVDEPVSIDIFKPIQRVTEILDNHSQQQRPLWLAWMGHWDGAWENSDNPFGAMGLSPWAEFKQRVGRANIIQDYYMYDYPYCIDCPDPVSPPNNEDYRSANINIIAELNYKQAYNLDPNFGASIQCGEIHNTQAFQRNVHRHEVLYNANLALMYGAKFIELWQYFAERSTDSCASGYTCNGIVYFGDDGVPQYSDKYFMLKDTLSPRLKGLFGKTLKSLIPSSQFAGSNGISFSNISWDYNPNGYEYIEDIIPSDSTYSLDEYGLEMGFFNDSLSSDKKYFMVLNRYYSSKSNYSIKLKDLDDYYNWNLINYVDTTSTTLLTANNKTTFLDTLLKGDANLYSIAPVVKYGGLLANNDTIKTNTTLSDNMTIDAGKVLQINEGKTYTITDTITFTDTSSFITGYGYVNRTQSGWITTRSWNRSLFKGRSGSHPKLIWSKHPDITNVIDYKIYRNHSNGGWQYLTTKSSNIFEYIDSTITIIEGMPQANETSTQYRVTATYRPSKLVIETSPTNTILYHRVEGQGLEKQSSGLLSNDFTFNLDQNYPNPFNPSTTISYSIAEDGIVTLEILNILGERIKTLVNDFKTKGNHNISFNASSLASGVYIYKIQAGTFINSKKMILLK